VYLSVTRESECASSDARTWHKERCSGFASRTIAVGDGFDLAKLDAKYADGVLSVKIPRCAGAQPTRRRIAL